MEDMKYLENDTNLAKDKVKVHKEFLTYKELSSVSNNKLSSGRIAASFNDDGVTSYSIPQYLDNFEKNIEDKVLPLVKALVSKGYMTISSCEGHWFFNYPFKSARYVTVCFNDRESLLKIQQILGVLSFVQIKEYKLYANKRPSTESTEWDAQQESDFLNKFFCRDSLDWSYLEISIGVLNLRSRSEKLLEILTQLPYYNF